MWLWGLCRAFGFEGPSLEEQALDLMDYRDFFNASIILTGLIDGGEENVDVLRYRNLLATCLMEMDEFDGALQQTDFVIGRASGAVLADARAVRAKCYLRAGNLSMAREEGQVLGDGTFLRVVAEAEVLWEKRDAQSLDRLRRIVSGNAEVALAWEDLVWGAGDYDAFAKGALLLVKRGHKLTIFRLAWVMACLDELGHAEALFGPLENGAELGVGDNFSILASILEARRNETLEVEAALKLCRGADPLVETAQIYAIRRLREARRFEEARAAIAGMRQSERGVIEEGLTWRDAGDIDRALDIFLKAPGGPLLAAVINETRRMQRAARRIDYYAVLNVSRGATTDEIREAYRASIRVWHPDLFADAEGKARADAMAKRLNRAVEVLTDPQERRVLDEELAGVEAGERKNVYDEINRIYRRGPEYEGSNWSDYYIGDKDWLIKMHINK